jgi:hypothetical protein
MGKVTKIRGCGRSLVVDELTGEVTNEMRPGDRVLRKESAESYAKLESVREWKINHYYRGNLPEIRKWMKGLSPQEKALLFTVSPYVGYTDCCLKHDNGNMFRFRDMVELSCLARSSAAVALRGLIDKDILYRGKNSKEIQYFMNPWLFSKGHTINKILQTMFRNYRIKVCQNIKWGNLPKNYEG